MDVFFRLTILAAILLLLPASLIGAVSLLPIFVPIFLVIAFVLLVPGLFFLSTHRNLQLSQVAKKLRLKNRHKVLSRLIKSGKDLSATDMSGIDLRETDLNGFDLSQCNLKRARLSGSKCKNVDFTMAQMPHCRLANSNLKGADFTQAHLEGGKLQYSDLTGANLINANLKEANLKGATLKNVSRGRTQWDGAIFNNKTLLPFTRSEAFDKGMVFVG